ncbi:Bud-site selection protein [Terfezia boudieri ATCC MYA-4762]|uniref:Bud-site selection protein n=1 Tax=Terfezia boudieri ATCC MYA-4762 TaxID=1051890 RepID=A0A3N4LNE4_9PEZI|nr:Bud-site selection protein [Terfezia boudieri ATCC MYA-4762]
MPMLKRKTSPGSSEPHRQGKYPRLHSSDITESPSEVDILHADPSTLSPEQIAHQKSIVSQKIHHAYKVVARALKVGRGFERQRLGKKLKTAREAGDEGLAGRVEREMGVLKEVELEEVARGAVRKGLGKGVKGWMFFPVEELEVRERNGNGEEKGEKVIGEEMKKARNNVVAVLYNMKPVRQAVKAVFEMMREVAVSKWTPGNPGSDEEEEEEEEGKDEAEGEDENENEDDIHDKSQPTQTAPTTKLKCTLQTPILTKKSKSTVFTPSRTPSPAPASTEKISLPITKSTFLPSLMGGYISGSESDRNSYRPSKKGAAQKQRKNRMGQQARRALAEKKYKENARHIKLGLGSGNKEDPKRGGRGVRGVRGGGGFGRGGGGRFGGDGRDGGSKQVVERKKNTEGPLHPSWEAARKAKEAKAKAEFQGKKIKFD